MFKKNYFLVLFILLLIFPSLCFASTNTFERTDDDLLVPDKIKYKDRMYSNVMSTPAVDASEKIYDFADLFTDDEEEELYSDVKEFINESSLDLAIVTISSNPKQSTSEYADDFYDYNDFDINGLVYVIDMAKREFYISTAGTAILYYDSMRIEVILTSMDNSMRSGEYKNSVDILIENLDYYYNQGMSSSSNIYTLSNGVLVYKTPWAILIVIGAIVSLIITFILIKRNKPVKLATDSSMYLVKGGIVITNTETHFVDSHTISHFHPHSDYSGGGGSGGGGSSHSGSSGMSHGGGGHKF